VPLCLVGRPIRSRDALSKTLRNTLSKTVSLATSSPVRHVLRFSADALMPIPRTVCLPRLSVVSVPGRRPTLSMRRPIQRIAVSSDGTKVFITGSSASATGGDYETIAYDASTGAKRWAERYNGPSDSRDEATSVAVSPNGSQVFVTGSSPAGTTSDDFATVAYTA
jgi:hypothetical protein